jgi:predicted DNA-binding transcriptional regulator AlpA
MNKKTYSTGEVAQKVGVSRQTLFTWIGKGQVTAPKPIDVGKSSIRLWTKVDLERVREFKGTLRRGPKPKKNKKK